MIHEIDNLKDLAFTIKIEPHNTVGHAAKVSSILKVLSEINKSYNNFLVISISKNNLFKEIFNNNDELVQFIKKELELLAVNIKFNSALFSLAPNLIEKQKPIFNDEFNEWKVKNFNDYKKDVIYGDYNNYTYLERIINTYNEDERVKIFRPIFSSVEDEKNFSVNITDNHGNVKRRLVPPEKSKMVYFKTSRGKEKSVENDKTILTYLQIKNKGGEIDLKKSNIKKVLYTEYLEHDTYPFESDHFKFENIEIIFHNKIVCDVTYEDDCYFISYEPFDITVWDDTREGVEEAFNFAIYSLYKNFANEEDSKISSNAKELKRKLQSAIKTVKDESKEN